jgi:hypothetical protein
VELFNCGDVVGIGVTNVVRANALHDGEANVEGTIALPPVEIEVPHRVVRGVVNDAVLSSTCISGVSVLEDYRTRGYLHCGRSVDEVAWH